MNTKTLNVRCAYCNTDYAINVTEEGIMLWSNGASVYEAFPSLLLSEKELLANGSCEECYYAALLV